MSSANDIPRSERRRYRLAELAKILAGTVQGDKELLITGVNDLTGAVEGDISFVTDAKYVKMLVESAASAVVAPPGLKVDRSAIIVARPDLAFARLLELFARPLPHPARGIHRTAVVECKLPASVAVGAYATIGADTVIGENTVIYPHVYIGPNVTIGDDCIIWPGAVIRERVSIGHRVILHPNVTIGGDGFGYNLVDGRHRKICHIGTVIIEDDVEIGAGSCVDRAKAGATVIGAGTKIDNLVQIAHNVKIGAHSIIVAQVGIAGSASLGQYVVLGGQAGVVDHISVGDGVVAAARCVLMKSIPPGLVVSGVPARDRREHLRQQAHVARLPKLVEKVAELTKRVAELEQTIHDLKNRRA